MQVSISYHVSCLTVEISGVLRPNSTKHVCKRISTFKDLILALSVHEKPELSLESFTSKPENYIGKIVMSTSDWGTTELLLFLR